MSVLTVTVPAGDPAPVCVPVEIVDDDVALEGNETFVVRFDSLDEGIVPLDPDEAVVTILDDDNGKIVPYGALFRGAQLSRFSRI